jgi:hypothetical protein
MTRISNATGSVRRWTCPPPTCVARLAAVAVGIIMIAGFTPAHGSAIFGTLSNFDIYNTTPEPCEGAEIELEGIDPSSVGGDFPAHYSNRTIAPYVDSSGRTGTRITYTGYNFPGAPVPGSLMPNPNPTSTNGHALTYTAGGEHFGFWLNGAQPSATRFFWLNNNAGAYERIGSMPESVPGPTWTYVPPANPGDAPVLQAVLKIPEPAEVIDQKPDSIWMKVFKTKLEAPPDNLQDLLEDLISGDPNDPNYVNLVPQGEVETEMEWELLDGGKHPKERVMEDEVGDKDKVVIRRYEFYKYIGPVNEENEPISNWNEVGDPFDIGERGDFISANMVAAVIPEPGTCGLILVGVGLMGRTSRRRRMSRLVD